MHKKWLSCFEVTKEIAEPDEFSGLVVIAYLNADFFTIVITIITDVVKFNLATRTTILIAVFFKNDGPPVGVRIKVNPAAAGYKISVLKVKEEIILNILRDTLG